MHSLRPLAVAALAMACAPGDAQRRWWTREEIGPWLRPVTADDPELIRILRAMGWQ